MKRTLIILHALAAIRANALPQPRLLNSTHRITADAEKVANKIFDYIVCGGGLTGLVVASRLSEDPNISVLVIENGEDDHDDPRVNDVRTYGQAFASELEYNLTSTPIPQQNNEGLSLVAGRTLGGSSSINGASWTKGDKTQYDLLPLLTGDDSWSFESLNEMMLSVENFNEPDEELVSKGAQFEKDFHGYNTELLQVSFPSSMFGGIQLPAILASLKVWTGMQRIADFTGGFTTGATIIPNMLEPSRDQNRSSSFTAFAKQQVRERENFIILTSHRAISIVWNEGDDMIAEGVKFQACENCEVHFAATKREVLLAAGSLQSPQILELSGVGDPTVLAAAGVPLKMASPNVGRNLQEQTKNTLWFDPVSTEFGGSGPSDAISFPCVDQLFRNESAGMYRDILNSLFEYSQGLEAQGIVTNATATQKILDAQVRNLWDDQVGAAEVFFSTSPTRGQVGVDLWNLIVLSRGYVHITSNSSWDHPIIEPSYFGHRFDLDVQVAAAKQAREVFQTQPLAQNVNGEKTPGLAIVSGNASDLIWESWIRATFTSVWHYIATLSMLKEELGGVVDNRLRVYGTQNVRAVDASVLPIQLSAHLSSSLYGVAEKAAFMIKEDQSD